MSVKENERWYQSAGQSARTHGRKKEGQENDDFIKFRGQDLNSENL